MCSECTLSGLFLQLEEEREEEEDEEECSLSLDDWRVAG